MSQPPTPEEIRDYRNDIVAEVRLDLAAEALGGAIERLVIHDEEACEELRKARRIARSVLGRVARRVDKSEARQRDAVDALKAPEPQGEESGT